MRVIIVGCGRVGARVAAELDSRGEHVTVIDHNPRAFSRLPPTFKGETARGNGTDEDVVRSAGGEQADIVMALTEGDNRNALAAQLAKHTFGVPRVIAKINDPLRAKAYAELGIATLCRTGLMVDAVDHYLGFPASGLPGMLAPTGHHGAHHDSGAQPATNAAGTLSAVGAASSTSNPVPNAGPTSSQEA